MKYYLNNLEDQTQENENFREVIYTGSHMQLVLMSLKPGENIGLEVHEEIDQFFRVEEGEGKVIIGDEEFDIEDDFGIVIPAGEKHDVINTSETEDLKLYSIYSPPEHPEGTIHKTKAEADEYESSHH